MGKGGETALDLAAAGGLKRVGSCCLLEKRADIVGKGEYGKTELCTSGGR